jgi:protein tyrosine phosphatase
VLAEVDDGQGLRWIASQGPLEETANDFWTMVWENHVSVVCMLTKLFERRPKCYKYWPDEVEVYGDITVQIVEVEAADGYIIRSFHVTRTGEVRNPKASTVRVDHVRCHQPNNSNARG